MSRILIIDGSAVLSAAVIAQLRGIAEICDSVGAIHIGIDYGHESVDQRNAALCDINKQVDIAAWQRANLTIEAGEPFITPTRDQGKKKAQWKLERNGRR